MRTLRMGRVPASARVANYGSISSPMNTRYNARMGRVSVASARTITYLDNMI